MRTILFLTGFIVLFLPVSVQAAGLTAEEAQAIALEREPGEIVSIYKETNEMGSLYVFDIQKETGTVMNVEVDGKMGKITNHHIVELGPEITLPEAKISETRATEIAEEYIGSIGTRELASKASEAIYTLLDNKPAYEVDVRRSYVDYDVYVDAMTGKVLAAAEAY